eukprot:2691360-Amphidinium_carterae.3
MAFIQLRRATKGYSTRLALASSTSSTSISDVSSSTSISGSHIDQVSLALDAQRQPQRRTTSAYVCRRSQPT